MTVRNNKVMMMSNRVSSAFAISALAVSMVAVSSSAHAAQRINNVSVVQTAPAVTQMRLGFTGLPVLPAAYQLDDPSRLVLDFEQVQNGLASRFNEYNIGMVNDVTTLSSDSTTRLIVGLKQSGNYTTAIEGNELLLTITDPDRPVILVTLYRMSLITLAASPPLQSSRQSLRPARFPLQLSVQIIQSW